jgi:hypothetical protein
VGITIGIWSYIYIYIYHSVRSIVEGWPHRQNAAEAIVALHSARASAIVAKAGSGSGGGGGGAWHGICVRLRIPYAA